MFSFATATATKTAQGAQLMRALDHLRPLPAANWLPNVLWGEVASFLPAHEAMPLHAVDRATRAGAHLGVSHLKMRAADAVAMLNSGRYPRLKTLTISHIDDAPGLHAIGRALSSRCCAKIKVSLSARETLDDSSALDTLLGARLAGLELHNIDASVVPCATLATYAHPLSICLTHHRFSENVEAAERAINLLQVPNVIRLTLMSSTLQLDRASTALKRWRALELLALPYCHVSPATAVILASIPKLTHLNAAWIAENAISSVARCRSLMTLELQHIDRSHIPLLDLPHLIEIKARAGITLSAAQALSRRHRKTVDIHWPGAVDREVVVALLHLSVEHLTMRGGCLRPDPSVAFFASCASVTHLEVDRKLIEPDLRAVIDSPSLRALTLFAVTLPLDWLWCRNERALRRQWVAAGKELHLFGVVSVPYVMPLWIGDDLDDDIVEGIFVW